MVFSSLSPSKNLSSTAPNSSCSGSANSNKVIQDFNFISSGQRVRVGRIEDVGVYERVAAAVDVGQAEAVEKTAVGELVPVDHFIIIPAQGAADGEGALGIAPQPYQPAALF